MRRSRLTATRIALAAARAGLLLAIPAPAAAPGGPRIAGCPVFPEDNAWNRDVSRDPVDPRSDAYLRSIGRGLRLHPDFGSGR